jgi:GMP synthase (glutamine-hydrolysing)
MYPTEKPLMNRIALFIHRPSSTGGRAARMLRQKGWTLDKRCLPAGDDLPSDPLSYAGAVIFGGPMSANDDAPWIAQELRWIETALACQLPVLGICLGAQLMARCLGARISPHPQGHVEIGYWPINAVPRESPRIVWPERVFQWHTEGFDLPPGAIPLAHGDVFPNQAFAWQRQAVGVQFHPEITFGMMSKWTEIGAHKLNWPGAQSRDMQLQLGRKHDREARHWLDMYLDHLFGRVPISASLPEFS